MKYQHRRKPTTVGPMGREFELVEREQDWHDWAGCHITAVVVMAVAAVAAGAMSYKAAQTQAKTQKRIAEANAQRIAAEKAEQLRKMQLDQSRTLSQAKAAAAASGMTVEGTQQSYIEQMRESFKAEQDWLQASSASQQSIVRQTGAMEASATKAAGQIAFVQGIGSAAGSTASGPGSYWKSVV